jgi:hypothetical protein
VHFAYGSRDLTRLFAIEEELEAAIAGAGVGELDGNDVAGDGSDAKLYMYGSNADALFGAVRLRLGALDCMTGGALRCGMGLRWMGCARLL